jgi:hypothetical protein
MIFRKGGEGKHWDISRQYLIEVIKWLCLCLGCSREGLLYYDAGVMECSFAEQDVLCRRCLFLVIVDILLRKLTLLFQKQLYNS